MKMGDGEGGRQDEEMSKWERLKMSLTRESFDMCHFESHT